MRKLLGAVPSGATDEVTKGYVDTTTDTRWTFATTLTSAATLAVNTNYLINIGGTAALFTLPAGAARGDRIEVKRIDGGSGISQLQTSGTDVIRGEATTTSTLITLLAALDGMIFTSDGAGAWWVQHYGTGSSTPNINNTLVRTSSVGKVQTGTPGTGNDAANKTYVDAVIAALLPSGSIAMTGNSSAPTGWLLCDGSVISRTGTYAALFAAIGTAYGAGDGSTTFEIPDFAGKLPVAPYSGVLTSSRITNSLGVGGGSNIHGHGVAGLTADDHTHASAAHTHTSAAHTHTSAAHAHTLSSAGQAQMSSEATTSYANRNVGAGFTANRAFAATDQGASTSARITSTNLQGSTDSATPGATGSTTPGATGSTTPGSTGAESVNTISGTTDYGSTTPPYLPVNFMIKI